MAHAAVSPRYNGFAADKKYHSAFGGWFPNASVLVSTRRRLLRRLAFCSTYCPKAPAAPRRAYP
jgi:hypothetical protein